MKPKIVFLDTETTGITADDRLIQLSYKVQGTDETATEIFKSSVPIGLEAMSVHHITPKMQEGRCEFAVSAMRSRLLELFAEGAIMVAHNAKFDLGFLKAEGVVPSAHICTLKVAQYFDEKAELPQYKLQFLRYFHGVEVEAKAHDAEGDVAVLEKVFEFYASRMDLQLMLDISSKPGMIKKLMFGKHKGKLISEVEPSYLSWLLGEKMKESPRDEDWIHTLTEALK